MGIRENSKIWKCQRVIILRRNKVKQYQLQLWGLATFRNGDVILVLLYPMMVLIECFLLQINYIYWSSLLIKIIISLAAELSISGNLFLDHLISSGFANDPFSSGVLIITFLSFPFRQYQMPDCREPGLFEIRLGDLRESPLLGCTSPVPSIYIPRHLFWPSIPLALPQ